MGVGKSKGKLKRRLEDDESEGEGDDGVAAESGEGKGKAMRKGRGKGKSKRRVILSEVSGYSLLYLFIIDYYPQDDDVESKDDKVGGGGKGPAAGKGSSSGSGSSSSSGVGAGARDGEHEPTDDVLGKLGVSFMVGDATDLVVLRSLDVYKGKVSLILTDPPYGKLDMSVIFISVVSDWILKGS